MNREEIDAFLATQKSESVEPEPLATANPTAVPVDDRVSRDDLAQQPVRGEEPSPDEHDNQVMPEPPRGESFATSNLYPPQEPSSVERWLETPLRERASNIADAWVAGYEQGALPSAIGSAIWQTFDELSENPSVELLEKAAYPVGDALIGTALAMAEFGTGVLAMTGVDAPAELVEEMRQDVQMDRSEAIRDAFARGDNIDAIWRTASGAFGDVYGNLKTFAAMFGGVTARETTWKTLATGQMGRASKAFAYGFMRTNGDMQERIKAGMLGAAYMMTPVGSSLMPSNITAVGADFILNSIITAGYDPHDEKFSAILTWEDGKPKLGGQYARAREDAKAEAEAMGRPDLDGMLFLKNVIPIVGADVGFSLLTRSVRSNNNLVQHAMTAKRPNVRPGSLEAKYYTEMERAVIKMGVPPELAANRPSEFYRLVLDGKISAEDLRRVHGASTGMLAETVKQKYNPPVVDPATAVMAEGGRVFPERQVPVADELRGVAERVAGVPADQQPQTVRAVLESMPNKESVVMALSEFVGNPATEPHVRAMYDMTVKESAPDIPRVPTKEQIVSAIADKWEVGRKTYTPEEIAKIEVALPETARVQVAQELVVEKPSFARFSENIQKIQSTIPLSAALSRERTTKQGVRITDADALNNGISIGIAALRDNKEVNAWNLDATLSKMVQSPKNGGVEGFGPSSAKAIEAAWKSESPEEALRVFNDWRMSKNKPPVHSSADVAGIVRQEPFRLSDEDRAQARMEMSRALPESVKNRVLDGMKQPLPTEPGAREQWIHAANQFGRQMYKADQNRGPQGAYTFSRRMGDIASRLQSSRYFNSQLAERMGDREVFQLSERLYGNDRRAVYHAGERFKSIGADEQGRVDNKARNMVETTPDLNRALVAVLGINPKTKSSQEQAALNAANEYLAKFEQEDPKMYKRVMKQVEGARSELQTVTAVNVRWLQAWKFEQKWTSGKNTLGERWADAKGNKKKTAAVMAEINPLLPFRENPDTGKVEKMPVEEMIRIIDAKRTMSDNDFRIFLADENFGTRKYYWMSQRDLDPAVNPSGVVEMFKTEADNAAPGVGPSGVINTRTGEVELQQGSFFGNLAKHMQRLEQQVLTIDDRNKIAEKYKRALDEGYIDKNTYDMALDWANGRFGMSQKVPWVTRKIAQMNTAFWTFYPAALSRVAWYSGRNVMYQGVPWGAINTQFRVGDVAGLSGESIRNIRDPNSVTARWIANEFQSDVSQKRFYFNEVLAMRDPAMKHYASLAGVKWAGQAISWMQKWSEVSISASDQWNRMFIGSAAITIGERYINRFRSGEITYNDVSKGLKLDVLAPVQKMEFAELFARAVQQGSTQESFYPFLARLAEVKNENLNFLYGIGGKSISEQDPTLRQFLGLMTFPRGQVEVVYQNGFKPMYRNMTALFASVKEPGRIDEVNFSELVDGLRVMGMQGVAAAVSGAVGAAIIGQKRDEGEYGLGAVLGYEGGSPGLGLASDALKATAGSIKRVFTEDVRGPSLSDFAARQAMFFIPMAADMSNILEASHNIEGRRNWDAIKSYYLELRGKADTSEWEPVQRDFWGKAITHPIFGTKRTALEDQELIQMLIDNNVLAKIIDNAFRSED